MNKCVAVIEEEERKNREEIYVGEQSLGRRALELVIMKKQLDQMKTELREMLVYQAPPELGALWTDVNTMMTEIGKQQKVLITNKMRAEEVVAKRRRAKIKLLQDEAIIGVAILIVLLALSSTILWIAYDRMQKYPQYGTGIIPRDPTKRVDKYIYIGR
jgi:hypothetical protein